MLLLQLLQLLEGLRVEDLQVTSLGSRLPLLVLLLLPLVLLLLHRNEATLFLVVWRVKLQKNEE